MAWTAFFHANCLNSRFEPLEKGKACSPTLTSDWCSGFCRGIPVGIIVSIGANNVRCRSFSTRFLRQKGLEGFVPWVREIESGQAVSGYVAGLRARGKKMLASCQECCSQNEFCSTCPWDDANLAGNLPLQSLMSQQDQLNGRLFL